MSPDHLDLIPSHRSADLPLALPAENLFAHLSRVMTQSVFSIGLLIYLRELQNLLPRKGDGEMILLIGRNAQAGR